MRTVFEIFLHDLRQLVRNPFALLVVVGLIALPCVYAWYSVVAMWSPYEHTAGLKVAVVNEDEGATYEDKELHVGDLLVQGIEQEHSFDWQFVDSAQGETGLNSGEYYAEFIIPSSFSQDFLSVLTGDLQHPTIEYWVNEKYNAVALEVTDAGAGVVDAIINRVFSAIAADVMSGAIKDVAAGLLDAEGNASSQVQLGLDGAVKDLESVSAGLAGASDSLTQWGETVASAKKTVGGLKDSVPDLKKSIEEGEKLLADVRSASHKVTSVYSSALANGAPELSNLLDDLEKRVKKATDAITGKQGDITSAESKAEKALTEVDKLVQSLLKADPDSKELANLEKQIDALEEDLAALEKANTALSEATAKAGEVSSGLSSDVDKAVKNMKGRNDTFNNEILPALETGFDEVALAMGLLDGALNGLDKQVNQVQTLLDEIDVVLQRSKDALGQTSDALGSVSGSIDAAQSDLKALVGSEVVERISDLAHIDVKSYGSFMSSPVEAQVSQVYPLNSYGAGVAPFYTSLAIWVGCFMLIAVLKLEVDPEQFPRMRPWQGYVGRLLLFSLLSLLQGALVVAGDMVIGVQAASPVAFVAAGLVVAFCFVNIVYALAITFKHVGKALAVIFLIVQIPGASGMYPIQLMPGFFQAMYPWLPFTYGMGAMREAIGGFYGATYAHCLLWLIACGLLVLALALIVRPRVLNLNRLFDRKLAHAGLYITEEHGLGTDVSTDRPVMDALLESESSRDELIVRVVQFARRYGMVRQIAPLAVIVLAMCLGVVSMLLNLSVDGKLIALSVFIAAVVAVFCGCVAFEYAYDNLTAKLAEVGVDIEAMHADEAAHGFELRHAPTRTTALERVPSISPIAEDEQWDEPDSPADAQPWPELDASATWSELGEGAEAPWPELDFTFEVEDSSVPGQELDAPARELGVTEQEPGVTDALWDMQVIEPIDYASADYDETLAASDTGEIPPISADGEDADA